MTHQLEALLHPKGRLVLLALPLKSTGKDGDEFTAATPATLPEEHGASESHQRRQTIKHIQADSKQDGSVDGDGGNFAEAGQSEFWGE